VKLTGRSLTASIAGIDWRQFHCVELRCMFSNISESEMLSVVISELVGRRVVNLDNSACQI